MLKIEDLHISFLFLYSHVKLVSTNGAYNCVLSFLLRESKIVFAGWTLLVNMSFSIPELTFQKLKKCSWLFGSLQVKQVFLLSFVNIS